ncbi:hypothetical protein [Larkinella sp. C7]|jgi:predicted lipoprotein|uniref:hypothetical protein n=1 Tax=Larkinella sp. C7 TaxID=2576607 RepID=UPI00111126DE|nr:hypothetical protein [Larkinella sp. C7]
MKNASQLMVGVFLHLAFCTYTQIRYWLYRHSGTGQPKKALYWHSKATFMQLTYKLPVDSLNSGFLEAIKTQFAGKEVNITVEDSNDANPASQMDAFYKMEKLRKKLKKVKVDPNMDLSALANEVNM